MKTLDDLIFERFGQEVEYESFRKRLLNIQEIMIKNCPEFKRKSLKNQFHYCVVIANIGIHSILQHMDENRPISSPKGELYEYSMDKPRERVKLIQIKL